MSKDVVNMIANLKQMWWRPYLLTFVSKYGLHHVYPLVNIIFDTYLLICKDEQIHFFMQWERGEAPAFSKLELPFRVLMFVFSSPQFFSFSFSVSLFASLLNEADFYNIYIYHAKLKIRLFRPMCILAHVNGENCIKTSIFLNDSRSLYRFQVRANHV